MSQTSSNKTDFAAIAAEIIEQQKSVYDSLSVLNSLPEVEVGTTPYEVIFTSGNTQLKYYKPSESVSTGPAILIVYALVNRPYILDLQPDRSLIKAITERGCPVYLIDWGSPKRSDRYTDLEDYICHYLDECVDQVLSHSNSKKVNLLGVCQGGTFSLCYTALNPDKVGSLIPLVTPVDFHSDNCLSQLAQQLDAKNTVDVYGNLPGHMLTEAFKSLMPMRLGLQKQLDLPKHLSSEEKALNFLRMEKWIHDSPDLCGQAFIEFMKWFFEGNRLVSGELEIAGKVIDLKAIKQPILNIFAQADHLVPPSAASALAKLTSSKDYQEECLPGGHIGVFVGKQAQQKLPNLIVEWLNKKAG